ncbi:class I SAM-dependent methyltransferase [Nonomuraea sp. NPDC050536]|uniref:class I SAM-dependent methyltransferase n=1 Tax=Nonomuraea sp. NPDC050536 TaxID=3364366 RepID=UPI0037C9058C
MRDAEAYERGFARLTAHTVDPLLNLVRRSRAIRLLDVGCGTGVVTGAAIALGAEVTAVDSDLDMLELTARRHPYATVRLATLPELPFPDETFDAVTGNFVINHIEDVPRAVDELHRVLRPGGTLALSWWKREEMTATSVIAEAAGIAVPPPLHDVAAAMREAGFSGVAVDTMRWCHRVDLDAWWTDVLAAGGPRFGVISERPPEEIERIRQEYLRRAEPYAAAGFPVCALLAHGTR